MAAADEETRVTEDLLQQLDKFDVHQLAEALAKLRDESNLGVTKAQANFKAAKDQLAKATERAGLVNEHGLAVLLIKALPEVLTPGQSIQTKVIQKILKHQVPADTGVTIGALIKSTFGSKFEHLVTDVDKGRGLRCRLGTFVRARIRSYLPQAQRKQGVRVTQAQLAESTLDWLEAEVATRTNSVLLMCATAWVKELAEEEMWPMKLGEIKMSGSMVLLKEEARIECLSQLRVQLHNLKVAQAAACTGAGAADCSNITSNTGPEGGGGDSVEPAKHVPAKVAEAKAAPSTTQQVPRLTRASAGTGAAGSSGSSNTMLAPPWPAKAPAHAAAAAASDKAAEATAGAPAALAPNAAQQVVRPMRARASAAGSSGKSNRTVSQEGGSDDGDTSAGKEDGPAKLSASVSRLEEALESARHEVERASREMAGAVAQREAADREVARVREQLRVAQLRATSLEAEIKRREEVAAQLTAQAEAGQRALTASKVEVMEEAERATRERNKRQRVEEENKALSAKVSKLRKAANAAASAGGGGSAALAKEELHEEVEAMRKLLNCNVCHERQKNVIITKCCHVFCDKCIRRNLEARNRKCPGCGAAFGQADVKQFFFT